MYMHTEHNGSSFIWYCEVWSKLNASGFMFHTHASYEKCSLVGYLSGTIAYTIGTVNWKMLPFGKLNSRWPQKLSILKDFWSGPELWHCTINFIHIFFQFLPNQRLSKFYYWNFQNCSLWRFHEKRKCSRTYWRDGE